MKIGILTSSRADYGIYLPLLKALRKDEAFDVRIIAFGTHLSPFHGHTIDAIEKDGFTIDHKIEHITASDSEEAITVSMGVLIQELSAVWAKKESNYDLLLCVGDRYEMFAAVSSAVPFLFKFAHIHGGETTLGAIDNEFRHCLTIFSSLHFVATEDYAARVASIKGDLKNIHVIGSLSLANLEGQPLLSKEEFKNKFSIDLDQPSILVTYHPVTVAGDANMPLLEELINALKKLNDYQLIITMPNADSMGSSFRTVFEKFAKEQSNVVLVENFGTMGYFSCMKWSKLVLGNSSSGIIEAASFQKYVVDVGDRQKGRSVSKNTFHSETKTEAIVDACREALALGDYGGENIYSRGSAVDTIIGILKNWKGGSI